MHFQYESNGIRREVIIRTQPQDSDWLATAVLLPVPPAKSEEFLRTGSSRRVVHLRSPTEQEAIERMTFILENVYGCTSIE